ncbi:MAG: hypothetical protein KAU20_03855 [Nanoarchaeota archaeon]|nr:hypothetical protein [Nanoarchaeota archaeon]
MIVKILKATKSPGFPDDGQYDELVGTEVEVVDWGENFSLYSTVLSPKKIIQKSDCEIINI